jgi:hypothetical protein
MCIIFPKTTLLNNCHPRSGNRTVNNFNTGMHSLINFDSYRGTIIEFKYPMKSSKSKQVEISPVNPVEMAIRESKTFK